MSSSDQQAPKPQDDSTPEEPLRSVHTSNFPEILEQLGISLLVTTYQAGKLMMLRAENGVLNTHFRAFSKPMGLAVGPNRIAIGTQWEVIEYHNLPAVVTKLTPPNRHDACFLPRLAHCTGDIQIHEMVWNSDQLWFVNTLFSCLAIRDDIYNFRPVWKPSFISQYVPGDCCHLNGLCLREGKPRYVTALGETDQINGWRENKKDGGILIDLLTSEIIARGLSMPHSPRWYRDRLWILESGTGSFGTIDVQSGTFTSFISLPGFTRGLSFCGPLAFIGLSQVRESAVFGGIPIAERALEERICGVYIVNIESSEVVAFVKFEDAIQEIFAVEVLHGSRYPELISDNIELLSGSFELPDEFLAFVPDSMQANSNDRNAKNCEPGGMYERID